jgi:5'-nucleotidase
MDGVMADFDTAALVSIPIEQRLDRSQFYVAHDYDESLRPIIETTYNAPGFFEELEPMPGMIESWQAMIDNGYHPQVASAPLTSNRSAIEGKVKWLDRIMVPEFGPSIVEEAIIDRNKWKYSGIALIDDRPDVPRGADGAKTADWEHVLFGWPHLSSVPMATAAFRLLSWENPKELLAVLQTIEAKRNTV